MDWKEWIREGLEGVKMLLEDMLKHKEDEKKEEHDCVDVYVETVHKMKEIRNNFLGKFVYSPKHVDSALTVKSETVEFRPFFPLGGEQLRKSTPNVTHAKEDYYFYDRHLGDRMKRARTIYCIAYEKDGVRSGLANWLKQLDRIQQLDIKVDQDIRYQYILERYSITFTTIATTLEESTANNDGVPADDVMLKCADILNTFVDEVEVIQSDIERRKELDKQAINNSLVERLNREEEYVNLYRDSNTLFAKGDKFHHKA